MGSIRTGVVVFAGALALSGCAVFKTAPIASQLKTIGSVAVHFTVCASNTNGSPPAGSCPRNGNSGSSATTDPTQVWVAFRVPRGTTTPKTFTASSTGPTNTGPRPAFNVSQSYTNELQRLQPAGSGQTWVGYVSQWVNYSSTSGDQNFTATVDFGLPRSKSGAPFAGPFKYQTVVGGQQYSRGSGGPPTPAAGEGINCVDSLTTPWEAIDGNSTSTGYAWICVDDSSPTTLGHNAALATRDAGIVPGKKVSASPGKKAKAKFTFKYDGAAPGASFKLKARTTLSGAKTTTSPNKITPSGTSSKKVMVTVSIPAGAKAGTYKVKLTAKLPDGEKRTGTSKLTVK